MLGPPLGGFITTYFDWRWIFLINLPIAALGMVLGWRYVPERREAQPAPLDVRGFLYCGGGLLALLFGVSALGRHLVSDTVIAASRARRRCCWPISATRGACRSRCSTSACCAFHLPLRRGRRSGVPYRHWRAALLLPLLLQLALRFHRRWLPGLTTFVSAVGAIGMKTPGYARAAPARLPSRVDAERPSPSVPASPCMRCSRRSCGTV